MNSDDVLFINNNGMTCCIQHAGSYLRSEFQRAPDRSVYVTPLDYWERIDERYVRERIALIGMPPKCEMCR